MKIKGHEKFVLREGWLTKGIRGVSEDNHLFSGNDGADKLGVGTNMVKSIRYWMQAFDLFDEDIKTRTQLNRIGEMILDKDLYLEDTFTLWLLHSRIAKNEDKKAKQEYENVYKTLKDDEKLLIELEDNE